MTGVQVRVAAEADDLRTARALEHDVFVAEGFTPTSEARVVEEYAHLDGLSLAEGFTAWVAVVEQWLLEHMTASGFRFQPMGASRFYMGGECLPVRMILRDALVALRQQDAGLYSWMTQGRPVPV